MANSVDVSSILPLTEVQRELLEEATASYQAGMTDEAFDYLDKRGVDYQAQDKFRLGVVGAEPFAGHSRFGGMISIPYLDALGAPLALRFRCFSEHDHREHYHGKYNSVAEAPPRLYNVGGIHRAAATGEAIYLTEGEFDCMVLEGLGLHAVAIPGVQTWKPYHRHMFAGFSVIKLVTDTDDEGEKLQARLMQAMPRAKPVRLPEKDVTDTLLKHGGEALLGLVTA